MTVRIFCVYSVEGVYNCSVIYIEKMFSFTNVWNKFVHYRSIADMFNLLCVVLISAPFVNGVSTRGAYFGGLGIPNVLCPLMV